MRLTNKEGDNKIFSDLGKANIISNQIRTKRAIKNWRKLVLLNVIYQ